MKSSDNNNNEEVIEKAEKIMIHNDNEVNDSSIELFSNIYAFTFNSSNLKNRIMKINPIFFQSKY